jgi:hypothetical protein
LILLIGYDLDGNLTSDGRWTYTWDAENRLTSMQTQPAAAVAGVPNVKLQFAYDAQGRRIQKVNLQAKTNSNAKATCQSYGYLFIKTSLSSFSVANPLNFQEINSPASD